MSDIIVLIPYYNGYNDLKKSLQSIKEKIKVDFLIVNDGSKKKLIKREVQQYCSTSIQNLYILNLEKNIGIENALNRGLEYILNELKFNYKYIARIDQGDCFYTNKLTKQLAYLESNPNIKLLGTAADFVDLEGNKLYVVQHPSKDKNIKKDIYLYSPFIHPSIMLSIEVIKAGYRYPTNYKSAEDYAFFFNIVKNFETSNLTEVLMAYEINPNGISMSKRKEQKLSQLKIQLKHFNINFYSILGILRTILLIFLPVSVLQILKKKFNVSNKDTNK